MALSWHHNHSIGCLEYGEQHCSKSAHGASFELEDQLLDMEPQQEDTGEGQVEISISVSLSSHVSVRTTSIVHRIELTHCA